MYGAVPLRTIKETLLKHKAAGTLSKVKMILFVYQRPFFHWLRHKLIEYDNRLTNCTFDGIVYNVQRVMEECLAIKPDLVFLWDEAWWAFAYFHYLLRVRAILNHLFCSYDQGSFSCLWLSYVRPCTALNNSSCASIHQATRKNTNSGATKMKAMRTPCLTPPSGGIRIPALYEFSSRLLPVACYYLTHILGPSSCVRNSINAQDSDVPQARLNDPRSGSGRHLPWTYALFSLGCE